jgi:hypothetical protein
MAYDLGLAEWVTVAPAGTGSDASLAGWVRHGLGFVSQLPAK